MSKESKGKNVRIRRAKNYKAACVAWFGDVKLTEAASDKE